MMGDFIQMLEERPCNRNLRSSVVQQRHGLWRYIPSGSGSWRSKNSSKIPLLVVILVISCTAGNGFAETQSFILETLSSNLLTAGLVKKNLTSLYTHSSLKKVDLVKLQPWYSENLLKQNPYELPKSKVLNLTDVKNSVLDEKKFRSVTGGCNSAFPDSVHCTKPRPKRALGDDFIKNGKENVKKLPDKSWEKVDNSISQRSENKAKAPGSSLLIQSMLNDSKSDQSHKVNVDLLKDDLSSKLIPISTETSFNSDVQLYESNPNLPVSATAHSKGRISPFSLILDKRNKNSSAINHRTVNLLRNNSSSIEGFKNNANYTSVVSETVIPSKDPAPPFEPNRLYGRSGQSGPDEDRRLPVETELMPLNETSQQITTNTTSQQIIRNTITSQIPTNTTTTSQIPTNTTTTSQIPTNTTTTTSQIPTNTTTTTSQIPTNTTTTTSQIPTNTTTTTSQIPTNTTTTTSQIPTNTTTTTSQIPTNTTTTTSQIPTNTTTTNNATTEENPISKNNIIGTERSTKIPGTPFVQPKVDVKPVTNTDSGDAQIACWFFLFFGLFTLLSGIANYHLLTKKKDQENVVPFSARRFSNP